MKFCPLINNNCKPDNCVMDVNGKCIIEIIKEGIKNIDKIPFLNILNLWKK